MAPRWHAPPQTASVCENEHRLTETVSHLREATEEPDRRTESRRSGTSLPTERSGGLRWIVNPRFTTVCPRLTTARLCIESDMQGAPLARKVIASHRLLGTQKPSAPHPHHVDPDLVISWGKRQLGHRLGVLCYGCAMLYRFRVARTRPMPTYTNVLRQQLPLDA